MNRVSESGTPEALWWVRVTDWDGALVYDGPAPAPVELVALSADDLAAGRLYTFDMTPMGDP